MALALKPLDLGLHCGKPFPHIRLLWVKECQKQQAEMGQINMH